ncbi:beta strand repeat-containing protein [Hymenobacter baengnokdamensis]|uniref:beta strand repeat-containing protein n=1 Tax=Hymenobacter baengnokdamensis TaxID=2615203 RepID=UPI001244E0CD|nr:hypothetical protein [Hymenobacter baengnokdamensis]
MLPGLVLGLLSLGFAAKSQAQSTVLEQWPLLADNVATVAVTGITPTTPTFTSLVLSDNSAASGTIPGYSAARGQAFAPLSTGGGWSSTATPPGPGTNPSRSFYEEFTVLAASGYSLRVDSLILTSAINNSAAGHLGVSYSTDGFTTINEVSGGNFTASGVTQPTGTTGGFPNPVTLPNQTAGPTVNANTFRLALNGATGVTVASGKTLSIRLYYGVGSSGTPRQAQLKSVSAKGASTVACNAAFAYASSSFCQSGANPTPTITGTTGGTFSSTSGLTIDATTGTITLSSSTAGTYTVTYTASSTCNSTQTVTITAGSSASFSYAASSYCTSSTATAPATLATGASAGTFSATPTGLTLDPATGTITPSSSAAGTYTVTNTVAASGSCSAATATSTVTITAPPKANIGYGATSYCTTTAGTVPLGIGTGSTRGTITVNPAAGLTIDASGTITPSTSTPGTYFITNTVAASGGCAAVTGGTTVTITAPATAAFSYPAAPNCTSTSGTVSPVLATGATAGTFTSTAGLTLNSTTGVVTPSTSTAGTYTVTNTVAASGGCAAVSSTATITISAPTTATFSYAGSPFCQSATNPVPTITGTTGGVFSSTTGLSLDATTGTINLAASTPGTYVVTYTVSGACGSSSTQTVTITAPATAAFSYPTTAVCAGTTGMVLPTLAAGATAGTFTSSTGLSLNATTGAVDVSGSVAGTYTVTNTVAASGGCAAVTATATIIISAPTTATFSYSGSPFCQSGANPTPAITGTTGGHSARPPGCRLTRRPGLSTWLPAPPARTR